MHNLIYAETREDAELAAVIDVLSKHCGKSWNYTNGG
jgi:hypothetical protein